MDSTLYRPNVAAILLHPDYCPKQPSTHLFFLAERIDMQGVWQFPQGGIDADESPESTLMRELEEEIGTSKIEILAEYPKWISYDFPEFAITKMRPYIGQRQRYFLARLLPEATINLAAHTPEFSRYEFVEYDEIFKRVTHFKRGVYHKVFEFFLPIITQAPITRSPRSQGGTDLC